MFEQLFSLKGKRVLVTGSSRGIGRASALLLGEAGAEVVFHASKASARLDETLDEARKRGIPCQAIVAELSDEAQVRRLAQEAGPVDILVLNASAQIYMGIENFSPAEWQREFEVNVKASFLLAQALLPHMKKQKFGRIVTVGSVNQLRPTARLALYASSKAAQNTLTQVLAKDYAGFGITANDIEPGVIDTDRNAEVLSKPEIVEKLKNIIPSRTFGTAEDCAALVLFLCSPAATYINGANIPVDGGLHL